MRAPRAVAVTGSADTRISETSTGNGLAFIERSKSSLKPFGFAVPPAMTMGSGRWARGSLSAFATALRRDLRGDRHLGSGPFRPVRVRNALVHVS
jgi:hypothetical protein